MQVWQKQISEILSRASEHRTGCCKSCCSEMTHSCNAFEGTVARERADCKLVISDFLNLCCKLPCSACMRRSNCACDRMGMPALCSFQSSGSDLNPPSSQQSTIAVYTLP
jgi:hypothetical protein